MRLRNYILESKKMGNTMIGFDIRESDIRRMSEYIESWLVRYDIDYEKVKNAHFTIAQITGKYRKDELVREINTISDDVKFNPDSIKIFYGRNTQRDYIVLEYKVNKKFLSLLEKISGEYEIRHFSDISPHISLFHTEPNAIGRSLFKDMIFSAPKLPTIKPISKSLWNKKFEIEYKV